MHRGTPGHMRLPHRLQGQKVKSQSHGAGAYCGGHLAAQLVHQALVENILSSTVGERGAFDSTNSTVHVCMATERGRVSRLVSFSTASIEMLQTDQR